MKEEKENIEEKEEETALEEEASSEETPVETEEQVDEKVDDKKEPPKFTLTEEEETPASDKEDEKVEIVHNGQVYNLTKEKIVELAQKGFDYDFKVGPHGKLAQMIEADPNLSKVVDDYWQGKVKKPATDFKIKPISEYEDEEEWLQDNLKQALDSLPKPEPEKPQDSQPTMADGLRMRDPEFFDRIFPKMNEYAENLSMKDYKKVDSDMGSLCQFYDYVKEQEMGKVKKKEAKPQGFRVKSGGGEAPRASDVAPAWKLSKEAFQKQLDKIKGYS